MDDTEGTEQGSGGELWKVEWPCGEDGYEAAYFTTEAAARASAGRGTTMSRIEVRTEPLRVEKRYRMWSSWKADQPLPPVIGQQRYKVNELQEDFGLPLTQERGWWTDGIVVHGPSLKEARRWMDAALAPLIAREQERLGHLAECTHQFRCPDHGDLSMATPTSSVGCSQCMRWVSADGTRYGYYIWHAATLLFSTEFPAPTDDLGPLPEAEAEARTRKFDVDAAARAPAEDADVAEAMGALAEWADLHKAIAGN